MGFTHIINNSNENSLVAPQLRKSLNLKLFIGLCEERVERVYFLFELSSVNKENIKRYSYNNLIRYIGGVTYSATCKLRDGLSK